MKKFFLFIFLMSFMMVSFSQIDHMKFKGIPMSGTLQSFTKQLEKSGYELIVTEDGVSVLNGEFAGYKNCTVCVVTDKGGNICKVSVIFPDMDKWSELEHCYSSYKQMLSEKYGEPTVSEEWFGAGYNSDDSQKIYGIKFNKYKYYSVFSCKDGEIQLEISHEGVDFCFIIISYFDNYNQEILFQQIMEDL